MFINTLKWMMLGIVVNIALTPWGSSAAIVAGYATIILTILATFVGVRGKSTIELNTGTKAVLLMFAAMVIGFFVDYQTLKFNIDFIKSIICFFCCYSVINIKPQVHRKKDLVHIFYINKLLAVVYIAYTFIPFSFRYTQVNVWGDTVFSMNMGNTNGTSMLVMFCIALLCMELKNERKRIFRLVNMIMIVALMYTLLLLKSRTVVLCSLGIIVCVFVKKLNIRQWYSLIIILIPVTFFVVQIILREMDGIFILSKALNTGRGEMFIEYSQEFLGHPGRYILGNSTKHQLANAHNAPVAILANFGIVGLISYLVYWKYQYKVLINTPDKTMLQIIALVAMFAFTIHSSAEAAPMLGSIPYSSAIIIIMRLAKDSFNEEQVYIQESRTQ